jgi:fatty-acyl-CoA synthase
MPGRWSLLLRMLPAARRLAKYRPAGRFTVADRIERIARRHPHRPFVLFQDRVLGYGEFNAAANRVAHWAASQGLGHGDVVALLMENRPEYLVVWAGLAKAGATTALLNTHLAGTALRHALAVSGAGTLVLGSECQDRFENAASDPGRPLRVWRQRDPEAAATDPTPGARDLDEALAGQPGHDPEPRLRADLRCGDPLFYIYTSGTTGLPKAARFSHLRFLGAGEATAVALRLRPGDVHYCALPLYHSAGGVLVVSSVLAAGATVALRRSFSASRFWDDIRRYDATCFQYIGEFCRYLVNQPPRADDREHRVRAAVGNGLRPDIWETFQRRFGIERIVEFYAATEGNTGVANLENKVGSVGRYPFEFMSNARLIRVDVETGTPVRDERGFCVACETGEAGEFIGRIPRRRSATHGRFEGYTSEEATEAKILRDVFARGDAWFRSGDLLRQDEEGFFYFVDRIGDTVRWKGENVSTQEVAETLSGFPGVSMVNVYGVAVEGRDGRAGMAVLVAADRAAFDGKAFHRFVNERLPAYGAPVFVRLAEAPDVTGTFKQRKVDLQREGFDVGRIRDPIVVRDDDAGAYVPLTPEIAAAIRSGARRL